MKINTISRKKLAKILTKGGKLIDIRSPIKFRDGTLDGAQNVTLRGISSLLSLPRDTTIVLYDAGEAESDKDTVNSYLWQLGFTNVVSVD